MSENSEAGVDFHPFLALIDPGTDYTPQGLREAIAKNTYAIIWGGLTRAEFLDRLFHSSEMRALPLGHLSDRCFTVPRTIRLETKADVEGLLGYLLDSTRKGDRQAIIARSLELDPARDAAALWEARTIHHEFFDDCIRGELDRAVPRMNSRIRDLGQLDPGDLICRLLLYFSAFEMQMLAALLYAWRHPPTALCTGAETYHITSARSDYRLMTALMEKAFGAFRAGDKNGPRDALAIMLRPNARKTAGLVEAGAVLPDLDALAEWVLEGARATPSWAAEGGKTGGAGKELYTELHDVTPGQALAFAAFRLVQLKAAGPRMVDALAAGKATEPVSVLDSWPQWESTEVAHVLHVYRTALLETFDSPIVGRCGDGKRLISEELDCWEMEGKVPAEDVLREVSRMRRLPAFDRPPLDGPFYRAAQRFDIFPEWRLRRRLVDLRRGAILEHQKHRPPNVRKASGKK